MDILYQVPPLQNPPYLNSVTSTDTSMLHTLLESQNHMLMTIIIVSLGLLKKPQGSQNIKKAVPGHMIR